MQALNDWVLTINDFIWQPYFMVTLLALTGIYLTVRTGIVQIRKLGLALRLAFSSATHKSASANEQGDITPFQALTTALSGTVGTGNIAGVATAIIAGGPGAVLWMWLLGLVGMATKYSEAVLGVRYRRVNEAGQMSGGPMYYIRDALHNNTLGRVLGWLFAFFTLFVSTLGSANMAQSNSIARAITRVSMEHMQIAIPGWATGLVVTVLVGVVIIGGIKRIGAVAEKLVPSMIIIYVLSAVIFLILNFPLIPAAVGKIVSSAFTGTAAVGGFIGTSVRAAISSGVSRGLLSNESGLGSAAIAHAAAKTRDPIRQGLVGMTGVFIDTILVCSMTAVVIVISGQWTEPAFQNASSDLTAAAFDTTLPFGSSIVAIASFLFGFSTIIGYSYYGEKCFEYIFGLKRIMIFRFLFVACTFLGSILTVEIVWALGTLCNALMAFPNLVGLLLLSGFIAKETREYFGEYENSK